MGAEQGDFVTLGERLKYFLPLLLDRSLTKNTYYKTGKKAQSKYFDPYLDYDKFPQHTQMQREAEDPLAENNELLQGTPRKKTFITVIYISI